MLSCYQFKGVEKLEDYEEIEEYEVETKTIETITRPKQVLETKQKKNFR